MEAHETTDAESLTSDKIPTHRPGLRKWMRVGAVAAASAFAGGLAAAWYYRKTLHTFREAESKGETPDFGISGSETPPDE